MQKKKRSLGKTIDSCQPAQTVQADMSRYFFADALSPLFTEHDNFGFFVLDIRLLKHDSQ